MAAGVETDSEAASTALARRLAAVIAILAAAAIIVQLGMNLARAAEQGKPLWMVPIDLFGYFTIWTNTLVALVTARFARGNDVGLLGRPSRILFDRILRQTGLKRRCGNCPCPFWLCSFSFWWQRWMVWSKSSAIRRATAVISLLLRGGSLSDVSFAGRTCWPLAMMGLTNWS